MKPKPTPEPASGRAPAQLPHGRAAIGRPLPSIVARAEAAKGRAAAAPAFGVRSRQYAARPEIEPRRDGRLSIAAARQPEPQRFERAREIPAMSAVREVEVEQQRADPQGAIDRAIATLDREARGEIEPPSYDDEPVYDDEPMLAPPRRNGRGEPTAGQWP